MGSVRVVLVDDEALIRSGLRLLLDGAEGIAIVGEAGDGATALTQVAVHRPDVVLLDIRMPGMDGLTCAERLLERDPALTVLILTTFDADQTVLRALEIGVSGFLLKDTPPAELVAAVLQGAAGRPVLSPSVTRQLIRQATAAQPGDPEAEALRRLSVLTEREREIALAVAEGLSNQQIASKLFVSLATVKTHVARVMAKLEAENRVQVALCLYRAGLG
ncbi:response regulator [Bogoriella caseilytica]|uniref:LuxR family two component transcriptional regulator n=1 Tax=Bogoriella caseilytica TaxID=56055 RepID=A0A3N2BF78_9MICO|nr:LuxR family two component transcriptional regulator [Bogoriella caseilytica]